MLSGSPRPPFDRYVEGDPTLSKQDRDRIESFAAGAQAKLLRNRTIPDSLYHYTDAPGLVGILKSHSLRTSHIAYLNDASEIRHLIELFQAALETASSAASNDSDLQSMWDAIRLDLNRALNDPAELAQIWVACFTVNGNQLSQWRAYGSFALEFDTKELITAIQQAGFALLPCEYEPSRHLELVTSAINILKEMYVSGRVNIAADKRYIYAHRLAEHMMYQLSWLAPIAKHPAFKEESEVRMYRRRIDRDVRDIVISPGRYSISGHIDIDLTFDKRKNLLPLRRVLVGPERNVALSRAAINVLLQQQGYKSVEVVDCKVPFRPS